MVRIADKNFSTDLKWYQVLMIPFLIPVVVRNAWFRKYPYRGKMMTLTQIAKIEHPDPKLPFRSAFTWSQERPIIAIIIMNGKLPEGITAFEQLAR